MIWRIKFSLAPNDMHVHCQLFCAKQQKQSTTYAKCGDFVVRRGEEFASLLRAFSGAEFVGDGSLGITAACNEGDPVPLP